MIPCASNLPQVKPKYVGRELEPWENAWYIVLNSNSANRKVVKPMTDAWQHVLTHLIDFTCGRPGGKFISAKQYSSLEQGHIKHRFHINTNLVISSNGIVFLEYLEIKNYIDNYIKQIIPKFKGVRIYFSLQQNYQASQNLKKYIEKEGQMILTGLTL